MNEMTARARNGKPRLLPVVSQATERSVVNMVLCATRFVHHPTPEHLQELDTAVRQMGTSNRRKNE